MHTHAPAEARLPPTIGPIAAATAHTAEMMPKYVPRSDRGTRSATTIDLPTYLSSIRGMTEMKYVSA